MLYLEDMKIPLIAGTSYPKQCLSTFPQSQSLLLLLCMMVRERLHELDLPWARRLPKAGRVTCKAGQWMDIGLDFFTGCSLLQIIWTWHSPTPVLSIPHKEQSSIHKQKTVPPPPFRKWKLNFKPRSVKLLNP